MFFAQAPSPPNAARRVPPPTPLPDRGAERRDRAVRRRAAGKTPEEIRKTFNIKNDFTPEEEEQVRKENEWCETTP